MGTAMILDAANASHEPAERPDRTALNVLSLQFDEDRTNARTVFLLMDALGEYADAVTTHMTRMEAREIPRDPEWIPIATAWFEEVDPLMKEIGRALEGIDFVTQTRAVAELRAELDPETFERLYRRCGFEPVQSREEK